MPGEITTAERRCHCMNGSDACRTSDLTCIDGECAPGYRDPPRCQSGITDNHNKKSIMKYAA